MTNPSTPEGERGECPNCERMSCVCVGDAVAMTEPECAHGWNPHRCGLCEDEGIAPAEGERGETAQAIPIVLSREQIQEYKAYCTNTRLDIRGILICELALRAESLTREAADLRRELAEITPDRDDNKADALRLHREKMDAIDARLVAESELAEARRDGERLDWMSKRDVTFETVEGSEFVSYVPELGHDGTKLRAAIDSALQNEGKQLDLAQHMANGDCK